MSVLWIHVRMVVPAEMKTISQFAIVVSVLLANTAKIVSTVVRKYVEENLTKSNYLE